MGMIRLNLALKFFFCCQSIIHTTANPALLWTWSKQSQSSEDVTPIPVITLALVEPQKVSRLCLCRDGVLPPLLLLLCVQE